MKNQLTHVIAGAVILAGSLGAGASFHHQQTVNAQKAAQAHQLLLQREAQAKKWAKLKAMQAQVDAYNKAHPVTAIPKPVAK